MNLLSGIFFTTKVHLSNFTNMRFSSFRPTTGKVSHVLLDGSDAVDEDDNFVVRETSLVPSQGILGDVDETPVPILSLYSITCSNPIHHLLTSYHGRNLPY